MRLSTITITTLTLGCASLSGQIMFTGTYTQDFDTLPRSTSGHVWADNATAPEWTNNLTLAGWYGNAFDRSGTDTMFISDGSGGGIAGNAAVTSFGLADNPNRSLGMIQQNFNFGNAYFGVRFENASSIALTELVISFTAQQWRRGANAGVMNFSYAVGADSLTAVGFSNVSELGFTAPQTGSNGTLNGTLPANSALLTHTITGLNIAPGEVFWLRWSNSGQNHSHLAIDNLTVIPEPSTYAALFGLLALGMVALRRRRNA